jgi:hypothetical protein
MEEGIRFDEPGNNYSTISQPASSGMVGFIIRLGLAKDQAGAEKVLLIALVVCILASITLLWLTNRSSANVPLPPTY